jgi:thiol-disulfide isomerase/thioredoxin
MHSSCDRAAFWLLALLRRLPGAALPLALGGVLALVAHQAVTAMLTRPPVKLPDMQLIALDGSGARLGGRNRPVVLNLWATWCPPCRREMPMMTDLAADTPASISSLPIRASTRRGSGPSCATGTCPAKA